MKKLVLLLLVLGLIAAGLLVAGQLLFGRESGEEIWTTRSPQAREEFEEALADLQRYYQADAKEHLERALELDPGFTIAKLYLLDIGRGYPDKGLIEELQSAKVDHLSAREQLLLRHRGLRFEKKLDAASRALGEYLEEYPGDPYALSLRCEELWQKEEMAGEAAACYRQMTEGHPNWVLARNRLGYLEMAQAQFEQAEQEFRTYQYIAPDQANPYDSLGELLTLVGRYEEAEEFLLEALRIKNDFCDAYLHLGSLYLLWGRFDDADQRLAASNAAESCHTLASGFDCQLQVYSQYHKAELEQAWQTLESCSDQPSLILWRFRLALATGRPEVAQAIEDTLMEQRRRGASHSFDATLLNMEGLRRMHEGEPDQAADLFAAADHSYTFITSEAGRAKMFNLLHLALALEAVGRGAEAEQVRERLAAVNPRYLDSVLITDLPQAAAGN